MEEELTTLMMQTLNETVGVANLQSHTASLHLFWTSLLSFHSSLSLFLLPLIPRTRQKFLDTMDRSTICHSGNTNNEMFLKPIFGREATSSVGHKGESKGWGSHSASAVLLSNSAPAPNMHSSLGKIRELCLAWPTLLGSCFKTNYLLLCSHVPVTHPNPCG